jgi:hypothetical protein
MHREFWWRNLKRSLGRSKRRRDDNIKVDLKLDLRCGLIWLTVVTNGGGGCCEQCNELVGSIKCGKLLA